MNLKNKISIIICVCMIISLVDIGHTYAGSDSSQEQSVIVENEYDAPVVRNMYDDLGATLTGASVSASYITPNLPGLRNQIDGSCWAHASCALADIYSKKQNQISPNSLPTDYSEAHMCYFEYNTSLDPLGGTIGDRNYMKTGNDYYNFGGSVTYAEAVLSGWVGFSSEDKYPYSTRKDYFTNPLAPELAYDTDLYLTGYKHINIKSNHDLAKERIKSYGGLATNMYIKSMYHNYSTNAYNCTVKTSTNHAITLVGWDDNYPASNFKTPAEGNGAWIVRNSYMLSKDNDMSDSVWNYNGYFYISYYDKSLSNTAYSFEFDQIDKYDRNYHYDGGLLDNNKLTLSTNAVTGANVFTSKAEKEEYIKAISFATSSVNEKYEIKIYKNLPQNYSFPDQGILVNAATTTGTTSFAGNYCIELKEPVLVKTGEVFSAVVKVTPQVSGAKASLNYEISAPTYFTKQGTEVNAPEKTSYILNDNTFVDLNAATEEVNNGESDPSKYKSCVVNVGNLRIKALTCDKETQEVEEPDTKPDTDPIDDPEKKDEETSSSKKSDSSSSTNDTPVKPEDKDIPVKTIVESENTPQAGSYKITYDLGYDLNTISNLPICTDYTPSSQMKRIVLPKPVMKGYKFKGWYLDTKKITAISRKYSGDLYLKAKWQENNYNLKFKASIKGDSVKATGRMPSVKRIKYSQDYVIPDCTYKKEGYTFIGWSNNKYSDKVIYKANEEISKVTDQNRKTITLYALWQKNE